MAKLPNIQADLSEFVAATSSVIVTTAIQLDGHNHTPVFLPPDQRREWEVSYVGQGQVYWRAVQRGRLEDEDRRRSEDRELEDNIDGPGGDPGSADGDGG